MSKRTDVELELRACRREQTMHGHDWDVADVLPVVMRLLAKTWDEGATKASPHGGGYLRSILIENPYRRP